MEDQCRVPGCVEDRREFDCCRKHSRQCVASGIFNRNDGIIDWVAVEISAEGLRRVALTWVEFEIAAAMMLVRGLPNRDIARRTGIDPGKRRREGIARVALALRAGAAVG